MLETGILPDFINVDGAEGGTGAAPLEFSNSLGTPLVEGLIFVHNSLVGCGLRKKIKIACAGKVTSAAHIVRNIAIGADWCNSARAMMMAVGCLQAQTCHTNKCPVGVATQDPKRYRALHVGDKADRVANYHRNTLEAFNEIVAAMGVDSLDQLQPQQVFRRVESNHAVSYAEAFDFWEEGSLLNGSVDPRFKSYWESASPEIF
jgi:glutamate synthase domain-containing protein 2